MTAPSTPLTGSEIAVVGMAVRAPGAASLDAFWDNLSRGVESIRRFSHEELVRNGEDPDLLADPDYVNARPVLDDIDQFDAEFFGLSPQDAAITDPQHRVFLEVGSEALEHAGHTPSRFGGQIGVFATCGMNSYMMYHLLPNARLMRTVGEWLVRHTGNDMSFLATSLSYQLDLKGPSLNVQCACSSALVAIHMAAQSLLSGECDMALAGGSVIVLPQDRGYLHQAGEILARDGHCRPFDAQATGTLFGSGAGVVVLRRLADALADGDHVLAVVKGSATNNDGAMKVGFLAPSVEGQSRVITEALAVSGVDASTISYVEAHGTGTAVGDPIEVTALTEAFRRHTDERGFCRIGSLKSNIGHLGEAAGVLGFIKTVLSLQHRQLPPTLNYTAPNPAADFGASPFVVNDALSDWTSTGGPRRAGVTALGAGGTNCHVILEEAPAAPAPSQSRREEVLVLSAKTPTALARMRENLEAVLKRADAPSLPDAAHTLQAGRQAHAYRWSAPCSTHEEAVDALRAGGTSDHALHGASRVPVVFLFPGGGAQYPNMGRQLYEQQPVFRQAVDHGLATLRSRHGVDLRAAWFPDAAASAEAARVLSRSTPSILSTFIVEYALARLWMSWGIQPAAMSGHSLGEYVAACLAGVFSVEDALTIVKARGDVFEQLPPGAMLSVLLPEASVSPYLNGRLSVAAVNSASSCVVTGPIDEIEALERRLTAAEIETQPLHIAVAAHSPMLDPYLDGFRRTVASVPCSPPTLPFVSNVTGRWITAADATDPSYWVRHLRQTVRFHDGLTTLLANPNQILLEVGPGRALTSLARQHAAQPFGLVTSLRHPSEDLSDARTVGTALGRLWALGAEPGWASIRGDEPRLRVPLPTYPFERQRHWVDAGTPAAAPTAGATPPSRGLEAQEDLADWFFVPEWVVRPVAVPEGTRPGDILVFADDEGIAQAAVARFTAAGAGRVHVVEIGESFARVDDGGFTVNPLRADDFVALIRALGESARHVSHIVYGFSWSPAAALADHVDRQLDRHFFGPLALAQAIGQEALDQPIAITFLVHGLAQIAGEGTVVPGAATVLGPCRVMPREFPNITTRVVDVVMPVSTRHRDELSSMLAAELATTPASSAPMVAYRGQTRWVESFTTRRLSRGPQTGLRDGGTYVITGGFGGLGLEIATHLARTCRANVVLVGRTALPAREDWNAWIAGHGPDDLTAQRITRVRECEALGAQVLVAAVDITDAPQVAALRDQVIARFGTVHGVFHTAGTLDDGLIQLKTRDAALAVLRPKVHGALAVHEVFGGDGLDFLALFSSVSALLGLQGQVDYTAANAFMDACATGASNGAARVVSIGWGPWRDVGLAVSASRGRRGASARAAVHPWLGSVREAPSGEITVSIALARDRQWMIGEHVVRGGDAVLPGTGYLELARAALAELAPPRALEIANLFFQAPVIVGGATVTDLDLTLTPGDGGYEATWHAGDSVYATGQLSYADAAPALRLDVTALRARCTARVDEPRGFLAQPFMDFGPRWANLSRVGYGAGEALLELALPPAFAEDTRQFELHPALLDMATGGAQALIPAFDQAHDFYVPFSYGRVRVYAGLPARVVSHVRLAPGTGHDSAVFDVTIADESGAVLVDITGFCMRRVATQLALTPSPVPASVVVPPATSAGALADQLLRSGVSVAEGIDALERILGTKTGPRVIVLNGGIAAWEARVEGASTPSRLAPPPTSTLSTGAAPADFDEFETAVSVLWKELLGVSVTSRGDNFFAHGGHSLIAVRMMSRIERQFRAGLQIAAVFEAPTVGALSAAIRAKLSGRTDGQTRPGGDALLDEASGQPRPALPHVPVLSAVPRESFRADLNLLQDDDLGESW